MAYRYSNRSQMALLPKSIEDYVGEEDPVRAYDTASKGRGQGEGKDLNL